MLQPRDDDRAASSPRVPDARRGARPPSRRRSVHDNQIAGPIPTEIGLLTALQYLRVPPASPTPGRRAIAPRRRRDLANNKIDGTTPTQLGLLTALTLLRVPPASPTPGAPHDRPSASQGPRRQPDRRPDPDRDRQAHGAEGPASSPRVPDARRATRPRLGVAGISTTTRSTARSRPSSASSRRWSPCEFPPRPRRPARRAIAPRRRRRLQNNRITSPIPPQIGKLTKLEILRVPPASPTPGAPRDRPSASQGPQRKQDRRPDPARDRQSHEADGAASSPRVPDARRAARPTLGVAGTSNPTRSTARSRPRSASSRSCRSCEFPPRPRHPARRATAPRRRRFLENNNKISGMFPVELCNVHLCYVKSGNDLIAPCGSTDCCHLDASTAPIDSTVGVWVCNSCVYPRLHFSKRAGRRPSASSREPLSRASGGGWPGWSRECHLWLGCSIRIAAVALSRSY